MKSSELHSASAKVRFENSFWEKVSYNFRTLSEKFLKIWREIFSILVRIDVYMSTRTFWGKNFMEENFFLSFSDIDLHIMSRKFSAELSKRLYTCPYQHFQEKHFLSENFFLSTNFGHCPEKFVNFYIFVLRFNFQSNENKIFWILFVVSPHWFNSPTS